jgi:hypothetical protein
MPHRTYLRIRTISENAAPRVIPCLGSLLLFAALGCGGGTKTSGDHAGQLNGQFQITPATARVTPGQTLQFSASSPWGRGATWSVQPATGGTITAAGAFTASSVLGQYQIVALWTQDVRYTATATVMVVAPGTPAVINPNLVQASGLPQASSNGAIRNAPVVGESVPAQKAASATGSLEVRHGFEPPPTR